MWEDLKYPEADVLVLAGDILKDYGTDMAYKVDKQLVELMELNKFVETLDYKHVILVAGNHDWVFQLSNRKARSLLTNIIYLENEGITIDNVKFYGSPWTPWFYDWAFNFPCPHKDMGGNSNRAKAHAAHCWDMIPEETDVLITHGPGWGVRDQIANGRMVGCHQLEQRIKQLENLRLHIFGHIHYAYGITGPKPMSVNASVCGENYRPDNPIQVINI